MEIFSIQHPLWKGKIPSSKENSPFLCESTLFIRETSFLIRLPIFFFGGGTGLRSLERALVFLVVGFEPGSTVPLNHARAGSKNCTVNSYQYVRGRGGGVTCICHDMEMCHYFGYFLGVTPEFLGIFFGYSGIFGYHFLSISGFLGTIFW